MTENLSFIIVEQRDYRREESGPRVRDSNGGYAGINSTLTGVFLHYCAWYRMSKKIPPGIKIVVVNLKIFYFYFDPLICECLPTASFTKTSCCKLNCFCFFSFKKTKHIMYKYLSNKHAYLKIWLLHSVEIVVIHMVFQYHCKGKLSVDRSARPWTLS